MDNNASALRDVLTRLAGAEADYRRIHDLVGGDHRETGRAWDLMRRAGDAARALLNSTNTTEGQGNG